MIDIDLINDKAWEYRGHLIAMYDKGYDDGVEAGERAGFFGRAITDANEFYKVKIERIRAEIESLIPMGIGDDMSMDEHTLNAVLKLLDKYAK